MEPTDFERWCAEETGRPVNLITSFRREDQFGYWTYALAGIECKYRAYMAGVRSRLPYQTPPKGDEDEMD
ncbi:TPA: hypothetical protein OTS70_002530 [Morganella morganii]|nr:hypothetical protein [Morganella morganii]